jgi:hypothetical protein
MVHDGIKDRHEIEGRIYGGDNNFVSLLSDVDLKRLREVVKSVHMRHYDKQFVTDYQADMLINSMAPETAEKFIRAAVDGGHVG